MKKLLFFISATLLSVALLQAATPATFTKVTNPIKDGSLPTQQIEGAATIFGDYNNDGLLDIFYAGGKDGSYRHIGLFKNNGQNQWESVSLPTEAVTLGLASAIWIDYDNDGDLDIVVSGLSDASTQKMYALKNKGGDNGFELDNSCSFYGAYHENDAVQSMSVIDYNNDGWMDFAITGTTSSWNLSYDWKCTTVHINQKGYFSKDQTLKTLNGRNGNVAVCDINGDGYFDIINTGYQSESSATKIQTNVKGYGVNGFINNQQDGFTAFSGITFVGSQNGAVFSMDVDNDGDQDIIQITRNTNSWANYAAVWLYDGSTYTKKENCGLTGGDAVVAVGDVNNDGNFDIYYAGYPNMRIAYGNGDGTFTEQSFSGDLADFAVYGGSVNFVDLNGDNKLDIHTNGTTTSWSRRNVMALNTIATTNNAPSAPNNLKINLTETGCKLSWDAASDDITPVKALRYNIVATNAEGKIFSINPADTATGKQKVAGGYVPYLNTCFYEFQTQEYTKFYVQAIDGANVASSFASIEFLSIPVAADDTVKGSVAVATVAVAKDSTVALPVATANNGYQFVNWTATEGITVHNATSAEGASITVTKAGSVTANFAETTYTISVVSDGNGSVAAPSVNAGQITAIVLPKATADSGYHFVNWTATEGITITNASSADSATILATQAGTVTAHFSATPTYALTITKGTGIATVSGEKSGQLVLPFSSDIEATLLSGYEFVNWTATPAENAVFANDTAAATSVTVSNGDVTVTANAQAITYTITYKGLEGAENTNPATYTVEDDTITFVEPGTRTGWKFTGWSPASIAKGSIGDQTVTASWTKYAPTGAISGTFNSWNHMTNTMTNDSVTIHLNAGENHWFKVLYGTTFYRSDVTFTRGNCTDVSINGNSSDCKIIADITGDYTFIYNSEAKQMSVIYPQTTTRTVYFDLSSFTDWLSNAQFVVWDNNTNQVMTKVNDCANDYVYTAEVNVIETKYAFKRCWIDDVTQVWGTVYVTLVDSTNACKLTGWSACKASSFTPSYTVHFNNNGHGDAVEDRCIMSGNSTEDPALTDEDYNCEGWFTDNLFENQFFFEVSVISEETTLYAKWTKKEGPTDLNNLIKEDAAVTKQVINGHLYILKNGVLYDATGAVVTL